MRKRQTLEVDGIAVSVSHLEKIYYPKAGFAKGDVLSYYLEIARLLLPHLRDRPLTLKRYPDGVEAPFFYEKRCPESKPSFVESSTLALRHRSGTIEFCLINNLPSLVWAANLGNLEFHVLLARAPDVERPTQIVFDLDPGAPADAVACAQVALWMKGLFEELRLESFVKSSGSKGLQLHVPLNTPVTYAETESFAQAVARTLERAHPELVVSEMRKELRRGKVLIDWSQNSESKTTVSVYSLRAKEQPWVALPLEWGEIERCWKRKDAGLVFFDARETLRRVKEKGDLFAPLLSLRQSLRTALALLGTAQEGRKPEGDRALSDYRAKRDLRKSGEPSGDPEGKGEKPLLFVIQKHAASHLHYDFRLELDGVLKSWAIPKGLPTDPKNKRLAVRVEDHPLDYARFEGVIPPGNYGAGVVMVWDIGSWDNVGPEPHEALRSGKLRFRLRGKKLRGEWALVKLHGARAQKGNEWLILKLGDSIRPISKRMDDTSALSCRSLAAIEASGEESGD